MTPLTKSPFSRHFNILLFFGAWHYETKSTVKLNAFIFYKLIMTVVSIGGSLSLVADLYLALWDIKRISWNLSMSILFVGMLVKSFQLLPRNQIINQLRLNLHHNAEFRNTTEDIVIHNTAVRQLKLLQFFFYGTATVCTPIWLLTRYFNHKGELPAPVYLPYIDLTDDNQFRFYFFLVAVGGILGLIAVLETELAMFSLMIQISREYTVLMKDMLKLNDLYEISNESKEVNPILKTLRTKMLCKKLSARQRELIDYTKIFEMCYTESFFQEFFGLSVLILTNGLQFLLEAVELSGNIIFQMGYLFCVTIDMFLICWFSTKLNAQCYEIGEAAYSTLWYRMEVECQKDIAMMILRSQHPPKITTAKLMVLDLNAFMNRMNNIISWLTIFRELLMRNENMRS